MWYTGDRPRRLRHVRPGRPGKTAIVLDAFSARRGAHRRGDAAPRDALMASEAPGAQDLPGGFQGDAVGRADDHLVSPPAGRGLAGRRRPGWRPSWACSSSAAAASRRSSSAATGSLEASSSTAASCATSKLEGSFTQPNGGGVNRKMLGWARPVRRASAATCWSCTAATAISPWRWRRCSARAGHRDEQAPARRRLQPRGQRRRQREDGADGQRRDQRRPGRRPRVPAHEGRRGPAAYNFSIAVRRPAPRRPRRAHRRARPRLRQHPYISCNPNTLRDNVAALQATHRIAASAAFDQFPTPTTSNAACCWCGGRLSAGDGVSTGCWQGRKSADGDPRLPRPWRG